MRSIRHSYRLLTLGWGVRAAAVGATALLFGPRATIHLPVLSHTFEENDGGWIGNPGGSGIVSVTHDAKLVKSGKGALQFAYDVKKGDFGLLMLQTPDGTLAKAKSLRFWIRADHATPVAVSVQEKDGGRYNATIAAPKDAWQQVELSLSDFVIDRSKDAPKDPDGKLDPEQIDTIAIADMAQSFIQGDDAFATALGVSEGPRKLYLDDFVAVTTDLSPSCTLKNGEGSFDTFVRPQIGWIAVGGIEMSYVTGKPLEGVGMQGKYHQGPGKLCGFARPVPDGALTGATKLTLSVASLKPAKIVVQLEEKSGGKYNTIVDLPGNPGRADLTFNIADFKPADDLHDDNGKLDMDQITQVIFFDATGLLEQTEADNTLWINNLKAAK